MMNNMFSIFDPSTSKFLSLNWLSISMFIFFMPMMKYTLKSRIKMLFKFFLKFMIFNLKSNLKKNNFKNLIFILVLMMMISTMNLLSLIPFIFTPTSHMSISLTLALPFWMSINIKGWMETPMKMFSHLVPLSTPPALCMFMVLIESTSNFIRPLTLAIRLSANMIAGHILIALLNKSLSINFFFLISTLAPLIMLCFLEVAVSLIQGYVFVVLMTLYLNEI